MGAKYRYPVKRSPKSDPQQYRVYRMENEAIGARRHCRLTRPAIRRLIRSIARNYRVPVPRLTWVDLGRWAAEWCPEKGIRLNTQKGTSQDLLTITHEMAHHLHFHLGGELSNSQESHGPEFMACHISILDTQRVVPVVGMRAICAAYKVSFKDPGTTQSLAKLKRAVRGTASDHLGRMLSFVGA